MDFSALLQHFAKGGVGFDPNGQPMFEDIARQGFVDGMNAGANAPPLASGVNALGTTDPNGTGAVTPVNPLSQFQNPFTGETGEKFFGHLSKSIKENQARQAAAPSMPAAPPRQSTPPNFDDLRSSVASRPGVQGTPASRLTSSPLTRRSPFFST